MSATWKVVAAIGLALVALVVVGALFGSNEDADVERSLTAYLARQGLGPVRPGSCVDKHYSENGLHLWNCAVMYDGTWDKRWNVAVTDGGLIDDASPSRGLAKDLFGVG